MSLKVNQFLKEIKDSTLVCDEVEVVLGNESADIDSVVCAISFAYFANLKDGRKIIPVINIDRSVLIFAQNYYSC